MNNKDNILAITSSSKQMLKSIDDKINVTSGTYLENVSSHLFSVSGSKFSENIQVLEKAAEELESQIEVLDILVKDLKKLEEMESPACSDLADYYEILDKLRDPNNNSEERNKYENQRLQCQAKLKQDYSKAAAVKSDYYKQKNSLKKINLSSISASSDNISGYYLFKVSNMGFFTDNLETVYRNFNDIKNTFIVLQNTYSSSSTIKIINLFSYRFDRVDMKIYDYFKILIDNCTDIMNFIDDLKKDIENFYSNFSDFENKSVDLSGISLDLALSDVSMYHVYEDEFVESTNTSGNEEKVSYVVKPGDSLSAIASRYGLTWQELYEANKEVIGANPNLIFSGMSLIIPNATQTGDLPSSEADTSLPQGGADTGSSSNSGGTGASNGDSSSSESNNGIFDDIEDDEETSTPTENHEESSNEEPVETTPSTNNSVDEGSIVRNPTIDQVFKAVESDYNDVEEYTFNGVKYYKALPDVGTYACGDGVQVIDDNGNRLCPSSAYLKVDGSTYVTVEAVNNRKHQEVDGIMKSINKACADYGVTLNQNQKYAIVSRTYRTGNGRGQAANLVKVYAEGGTKGYWNFVKRIDSSVENPDYRAARMRRAQTEYYLFTEGYLVKQTYDQKIDYSLWN